jgi:hypothetical protein
MEQGLVARFDIQVARVALPALGDRDVEPRQRLDDVGVRGLRRRDDAEEDGRAHR